VKFAGRDDQYVVVGTVKDLQLRPRSHTCGYLVLYRLSHTGDQLELVHRTEVDDLPAAIAPFQGRLLVGVGRYLRIYDYGKKKLLRKCENKVSVLTLSPPFPLWLYTSPYWSNSPFLPERDYITSAYCCQKGHKGCFWAHLLPHASPCQKKCFHQKRSNYR